MQYSAAHDIPGMEPVECHVAGSRTCVFAFASAGVRQLEWGATLRPLGVSHVLLKNWGCAKTMRGIQGMDGCDLYMSMLRVREMANGYERTVALGLSSGGYDALLYAVLVPFHEVIAISATTGGGYDIVNDIPEGERQRFMEESPFYDLKPLYSAGPPVKVEMFVSDGPNAELDFAMARRIKHGNITYVPGHSHAGLGAYLRDVGVIQKLICR